VKSKRIVIESPLSAPTPEGFVRNFRYLLWCCRAVWLRDGLCAIASHLICPWYLDDTNEAERAAGIANSWAWAGEPHWFFEDIGSSVGMGHAAARCLRDDIAYEMKLLGMYAPECWESFERGEFPPHTPGFEMRGAE
jgi:hypothetical protein